jgi:hypothetical protein
MQTYLVEHFWSGVTKRAVLDALDRVGTSAAALAKLGIRISCHRVTLIPGDESVLWAFEAESIEHVQRCAAGTAMVFDRLTESFEIRPSQSQDGHVGAVPVKSGPAAANSSLTQETGRRTK